MLWYVQYSEYARVVIYPYLILTDVEFKEKQSNKFPNTVPNVRPMLEGCLHSQILGNFGVAHEKLFDIMVVKHGIQRIASGFGRELAQSLGIHKDWY